MQDVEELATQARTVIATARAITLMISGVGPVTTDDPVSFAQADDGVPTFLCEPGSRVCPAIGQCAVLRAEAGDGAVAMLGRLRRVGTRTVEGIVLDVVALQPDNVVLEPCGQRAARREVPIEAYLAAGLDQLRCRGERFAMHANRMHGSRLRAAVARRAGVPQGAIAAARISRVDEHGVTIEWIGEAGGDVLDIAFATPARTAEEWARRLRTELG